MDAPTTEAHSLQKKESWRQAVKSGKENIVITYAPRWVEPTTEARILG